MLPAPWVISSCLPFAAALEATLLVSFVPSFRTLHILRAAITKTQSGVTPSAASPDMPPGNFPVPVPRVLSHIFRHTKAGSPACLPHEAPPHLTSLAQSCSDTPPTTAILTAHKCSGTPGIGWMPELLESRHCHLFGSSAQHLAQSSASVRAEAQVIVDPPGHAADPGRSSRNGSHVSKTHVDQQ